MLFFYEHHGMEGENLFRVNRLRNKSFPAHLHRAYELIAVNAGTLSLVVEQKQYKLAQGDVAFLFCNQIHSFTSPEESDIFVVLFSPEIIGDFYSAYKKRIPENNVIHFDEPLPWDNLHSIYAQKSLLYHICDRLLASTRLESAGSRSQLAVLQQIFAYVDEHFGETCSLKMVAAALRYDYVYLSRLFTRLAGVHFTVYLNNYRIAQACYLLDAGKLTVTEIASVCGYDTLRTFHRNFRSVMHCSPRQYLATGGGR